MNIIQKYYSNLENFSFSTQCKKFYMSLYLSLSILLTLGKSKYNQNKINFFFLLFFKFDRHMQELLLVFKLTFSSTHILAKCFYMRNKFKLFQIFKTQVIKYI